MTIGHHPAVIALHKRHLEMSPQGDYFILREAAKVVTAG
jgi:hypothetical protein